MPIVRTFAPVVAGAADMTYRRFATYNIVGGILWITSMTLTGYFLGLRDPEPREEHPPRRGGGDLPVAAAGDHRVAEVEDRDRTADAERGPTA